MELFIHKNRPLKVIRELDVYYLSIQVSLAVLTTCLFACDPIVASNPPCNPLCGQGQVCRQGQCVDSQSDFGLLKKDAGLLDSYQIRADHETSPNPLPSIAVGFSHTCTITQQGQLLCWGYNQNGQLGDGTRSRRNTPRIIGNDTHWRFVSAGSIHTCALKDDDSLWCWGDNRYGQLGVGENEAQLIPKQVLDPNHWHAVSVGKNHTCAIKADDSLWCWGRNNYGQIGANVDSLHENLYFTPNPVLPKDSWQEVSSGSFHSCGIQTDGSLWCWGNNESGQIGDGTNENRNLPAKIMPGSKWKKVSAGSDHSCGIQADGSLWCWGNNRFATLGDGTLTDREAPTLIDKNNEWVTISAGNYVTCGITKEGKLWCWGYGHWGLFSPRQSYATHPKEVIPPKKNLGTWLNVALKKDHICAISSKNHLFCWGLNSSGQIGNGHDYAIRQPVLVAKESDWKDIATSAAQCSHTCGIKSDRSLWCWGKNSDGQLGLGNYIFQQHPVPIAQGRTWQSIALARHTCGILLDGSLWCWGINEHYQLGTGDKTIRLLPTRISDADTWNTVATNFNYSCGVKTDHSLWCWGELFSKTDGRAEIALKSPQKLADGEWKTLSAGQNHLCGIQQKGSLWCWGINSQGQLGDKTTTTHDTPTIIGDDVWREISIGFEHTCGIQQNGSLWCWGSNAFGQLGVIGPSKVTHPLQIAKTQTWTHISAGDSYTCGIQTDGSLWCWGWGLNGELGLGNPSQALTPKKVSSQTPWKKISAGKCHSCGIQTDGTLWCWGSNYYGQIGINTAWEEAPVRVLTY